MYYDQGDYLPGIQQGGTELIIKVFIGFIFVGMLVIIYAMLNPTAVKLIDVPKIELKKPDPLEIIQPKPIQLVGAPTSINLNPPPGIPLDAPKSITLTTSPLKIDYGKAPLLEFGEAPKINLISPDPCFGYSEDRRQISQECLENLWLNSGCIRPYKDVKSSIERQAKINNYKFSDAKKYIASHTTSTRPWMIDNCYGDYKNYVSIMQPCKGMNVDSKGFDYRCASHIWHNLGCTEYLPTAVWNEVKEMTLGNAINHIKSYPALGSMKFGCYTTSTKLEDVKDYVDFKAGNLTISGTPKGGSIKYS